MRSKLFSGRRRSKSNDYLKAFTLLECLVALFVFSVFLLMMNGAWTQGRQVQQVLRNQAAYDFETFMIQLENELADAVLVAAVGDNMELRLPDSRLIKIESYKDKVIKTPGYQPLLMRIKSASFTNGEDKSVNITVVFQSGEVHHGKWTIPET